MCLKKNCSHRKGAAPPDGDANAEVAGEAKDIAFLDACIAEEGASEDDTLTAQSEGVVETLVGAVNPSEAVTGDQTIEHDIALERKLLPIAATAMSYRTLYENFGVAVDARV